MKRTKQLLWLVLVAVFVAFLWSKKEGIEKPAVPTEVPVPTKSESPKMIAVPSAGERLLEGYGDPSTPPIEDLRKIHRVLAGYFSVIKDPVRYPIGGNEDLAAALKGENVNREVFVPAGHPVFSKTGLLTDRWGTPVIVHPEGWKQIGLRSAGEDRKPYTDDDLILLPTGMQTR
ncbi:MAG TPA: hypothetical protein VM511_03205 [Luteolibacter sp.]|nr:hypothetical protein [Luteolibacter sp.]